MKRAQLLEGVVIAGRGLAGRQRGDGLADVASPAEADDPAHRVLIEVIDALYVRGEAQLVMVVHVVDREPLAGEVRRSGAVFPGEVGRLLRLGEEDGHAVPLLAIPYTQAPAQLPGDVLPPAPRATPENERSKGEDKRPLVARVYAGARRAQ